MELAPDAVVVVGDDGRIALVNAQTERWFGYPREELIGAPVELLVPDTARRTHGALRRTFARAPRRRPMGAGLDLEGQRKDGTRFPVEISLGPLEGVPGLATMAIVRDASDRREHDRALQWLADHDELTGLLNRRAFTRELERHLAVGRRYGASGALLLIDLDGFKAINDTFGHAAGDELLGAAGAALRERLRTSDIAGRLGGDEFAVLLPRGEGTEAEAVAAAILAVLRRPVRDGLPALTASIGIELLDGERTAKDALRSADRAMYAVKAAGGDAAAPPPPHALVPPANAKRPAEVGGRPT